MQLAKVKKWEAWCELKGLRVILSGQMEQMEKCEFEERDRGHATWRLNARLRGLSCVPRALGATGGPRAGEGQGQLGVEKDPLGHDCRKAG